MSITDTYSVSVSVSTAQTPRLNDNPANTAGSVFRLMERSTRFGGKMKSRQELSSGWAHG